MVSRRPCRPTPALLTGAQLSEIVELLRPLAEPTRLRVSLACIAQPAPVGEIAAGVNFPRVSGAITPLRAGRLPGAARNGKQMIYGQL